MAAGVPARLSEPQVANSGLSAVSSSTEFAEATTLGTPAAVARGISIASRLPRLGYMELILTDECNLRCTYCFERAKNPHCMSYQTAVAAIDFLLNESGAIRVLTILLFGGEPLLQFDLIQRIHTYATHRARQVGKVVNWDMTTNGTLITEHMARWLKKAGVKYLLSVDGGREDNDRHRRFPDGRGSFDVVAQRVGMMKHYQPWMGAKISVTPQSAGNLRDAVSQLYAVGFNQFVIGCAHGIRWSVDELCEYERGMYELCELYLEKKYEDAPFRMTLFEDGEVGAHTEKQGYGCGAGRGRVCVDSYGDIYGCSKLATITGMRSGVMPYGNVFQGFTRVENRLPFLVADVGPRASCAQCEMSNACGGGCPAVNYAAMGSIFCPDEFSCRVVYVNQRIHAYMTQRLAELRARETRRDSPNKKGRDE